MAIKDFKNIEKINQEVDSTAQLIKPADLNIFKTSARNVDDFGLSKNDAIEFRLYDISNNLLEQTGAKSVRYIHKDELPTYLKAGLDINSGEKIYDIDVEKLVFEAGYGNGEFRVSFAFVKNYVGNENAKKRVWIHEVSPSRTEIRVLPLLGSDTVLNADLEDRYYSFMDNVSELRQSYKKIVAFLDKIELNISTLIDDYFISSFGPMYIEVINKDFLFGGQEGYTNFKNKIYTDFRESTLNEINGKQFQLGAADYGQQITNVIDLDDFVSSAEFRLIIQNRLRGSIEYNMQFLRKREYTLIQKAANGSFRPSKDLQSLLNTGYDSVTRLQTQESFSGVGANKTNKTVFKTDSGTSGKGGTNGTSGTGGGTTTPPPPPPPPPPTMCYTWNVFNYNGFETVTGTYINCSGVSEPFGFTDTTGMSTIVGTVCVKEGEGVTITSGNGGSTSSGIICGSSAGTTNNKSNPKNDEAPIKPSLTDKKAEKGFPPERGATQSGGGGYSQYSNNDLNTAASAFWDPITGAPTAQTDSFDRYGG